MKNILKNYKQTIILLAGIIVGCAIGLIAKEKAAILKPFGDLFLNLLLVIIVPLIFLTISTSIGNMNNPKRVGKVLGSIIVVFIITSLVSVFYGFGVTYWSNLVELENKEALREEFSQTSSLDEEIEEEAEDDETSILENTVSLLTVNDFYKLLSKDHIMALLVFSVIFGISINLAKEKAHKTLEILNSLTEVVNNFIKIIMYYAPIGLGAYFAALIGTLGKEIAQGYLKTFIIYTVVSVIFYFVVYSIYAYISAGKEGFKRYWQNILPATFTALGTCSSAATIPVNVEVTKKIGVPDDIAETTVPLGTNFHKDGTIIGSMFKIMFLACLFGLPQTGVLGVIKLLGVALLANLLVTAVPIGGGAISEALIISLLGFPMAALPILTTIATVIDAPATMLNVVGDSASSMLVARIVGGKDWLQKSLENKKEEE